MIYVGYSPYPLFPHPSPSPGEQKKYFLKKRQACVCVHDTFDIFFLVPAVPLIPLMVCLFFSVPSILPYSSTLQRQDQILSLSLVSPHNTRPATRTHPCTRTTTKNFNTTCIPRHHSTFPSTYAVLAAGPFLSVKTHTVSLPSPRSSTATHLVATRQRAVAMGVGS